MRKLILPVNGMAYESKYMKLFETDTEYVIVKNFHFDGMDNDDWHLDKSRPNALMVAIEKYYLTLIIFFYHKANLYERYK